jgi:hypothetical protein
VLEKQNALNAERRICEFRQGFVPFATAYAKKLEAALYRAAFFVVYGFQTIAFIDLMLSLVKAMIDGGQFKKRE